MADTALDYFAANLPRKPYHTDELLYGLRIAGKERAMLAKFIQQNQPHASYWLVFDVDRNGAAMDWSDRNGPTPNITVKNHVNGHAHLLYGLQTAVRTAPDSSLKALTYAAAVERGLCARLDADPNYSGLLCKNPLNDHWGVTEWRSATYTLDELADYVDLRIPEVANEADVYGLGRNCQLFDKTRRWAYKAIRQGWPDFDLWLLAVIQRVEMHNTQLTNPLSLAECACIGRSIAKWTHQRFTAHTFSQIQAIKGTKGGQRSKGGGRPSLGEPWKKLGISRSTYFTRKRSGELD